jgi:uncharacterized protein YndB with AHSA1/START domain
MKIILFHAGGRGRRRMATSVKINQDLIHTRILDAPREKVWKVRITVREVGIPDVMIKSAGMGWNQSFDKLADALAKTRVLRAA